MLIVWQYPPDERFLMPIFPLLIAGLLAELQHIYAMGRNALRHKDLSQRVVGGAFSAGVAAVLLAAIGLQTYITVSYLGNGQADRDAMAKLRTVSAWISQNLPPNSAILSSEDPLIYLYSGHPGNAAEPLTRDWCYGDSYRSILNTYRNIASIARCRGLSYLYAAPGDITRMSRDADLAAQVELSIRTNPDLIPVYQGPSGTLYKVREAQ